MPFNDKDLPIGYVEVSTKTQMSKNDIKAKFSNVSFSSVFQPPEGYAELFEGQQAQPTRYQVGFADGLEQIDGKWYTKYSVAEMDQDAKTAKDTEQAKAIRSQRADKLKGSDWTQVADAPVDKAAWATYRQALRDITAQSGFPWDTQWPDAPV
jgi:hypothetical protein